VNKRLRCAAIFTIRRVRMYQVRTTTTRKIVMIQPVR
jgi:hypothetical protein